MKLVPKQTVVESNLKFFGLAQGQSEGSTISTVFDIIGEGTHEELRLLRFEEKERLDAEVLMMELARGSISKEQYQDKKQRLKARYDSLLKRNTDAEAK